MFEKQKYLSVKYFGNDFQELNFFEVQMREFIPKKCDFKLSRNFGFSKSKYNCPELSYFWKRNFCNQSVYLGKYFKNLSGFFVLACFYIILFLFYQSLMIIPVFSRTPGEVGGLAGLSYYGQEQDAKKNNSQNASGLIIKPKASFLNAKMNPSSTSFTIGVISNEQNYKVMEVKNNWYKVQVKEGIIGWVPKSAVKIISYSKTTASIHAPQKRPSNEKTQRHHLISAPSKNLQKIIVVNVAYLNIINKPSGTGLAVGVLEKGVALPVLEEKNGWYKIKYKNIDGWIPQEAVQLKNPRRIIIKKQTVQVPLSSRRSPFLVYAKHTVLGISMLTSGMAIYYYKKGNDTYGKYKVAQTRADVMALYQKTLDYDKKRNAMYVATSAGLGFAIFFHIMDEFNLFRSRSINVTFNYKKNIGSYFSLNLYW